VWRRRRIITTANWLAAAFTYAYSNTVANAHSSAVAYTSAVAYANAKPDTHADARPNADADSHVRTGAAAFKSNMPGAGAPADNGFHQRSRISKADVLGSARNDAGA
jgi:hypothetical protein